MISARIHAIIFDFGNVLVDWNPRYVFRRFFPEDEPGVEAFLKEINFTEWNAQQDRGRPFDEGIAILSQEFPHRAHMIQAYHDHWQDSLGEAISGSIEILYRLKENGHRLFGLSNWSAQTFPIALSKFDFFSLLDDMVVSGFVGVAKPDPAIYNLLLEKIGRPADECLLIDDALPNIEQAATMGFKTIHFSSPGILRQTLVEMELL
jgi:2-haloacid dehalogenase